MKKRNIALIIIGALGILVALNALIGWLSMSSTQLQSLVDSQVSIYEESGVDTETAKLIGQEMQSSIVPMEISLSFASIIFYTLTILLSSKSIIQNHKKLFVSMSIINIFLTFDTIIGIPFAFATFIILCTLKKDKNYINEKILEISFKQDKNEKIKGIIGIVAYFLVLFGLTNLLKYLFNNEWLENLIPNLFLLVIVVALNQDYLSKQLKLFFKNIVNYITFLLPKLLIIFALQVIASFITYKVLGTTQSANQLNISTLGIPLVILIELIYAPIVEEMTFRYSIRNLISNKYVFIIISGLLFAIFSVIPQENLFVAIVQSIYYFVMGAGMAYIYNKTNNICCSMTYHFIINLLAVLIAISSSVLLS